MSAASARDVAHMRHALRLAERTLGSTAPNPAVGCVIVRQGHVVGRGWTRSGGRPHAETIALIEAGAAARGATAYVTLEPCAHHGQTPPCANALVDAQLARVVAAMVDPDPRVAGAGLAHLEQHGIAVTCGVLQQHAEALNAGFVKRVTASRPLVAIKIAQTLDGRVADPIGNSRWITSAEARRHAHLLRTHYDAIMVGIGTVLTDDPLLTCRLPGLEHRSPFRVVLDSKLQLPPDSQLAKSARKYPVAVFTLDRTGGNDLAASGVTIERMREVENGWPAIRPVLEVLARRGITRLLVEGGPRVIASIVKSGFADLLHLYRAPILLGGAGMPAIGHAWQSELVSAPRLRLLETIHLGPDVLDTFSFS
ncbi:MAG TPA: bifunctional diaminohydroxyphosphoribosylaminopyrimidine deaminase/5-amino-6-(5-phosphoribosylamino)uracil reductase RibD [Micropepsaceae bacterium]|nr:bifunctional diaminohydroxyphosphoribosylaminopyrimidine deaminase/5-amino-6-(5-phosphoribosylamino)uracil reductase RibD [Micropepsaceae bacterium]